MPLTAILENDIVCALDAEDKSLNYKCKWCDSAMVLKRGQIKIAHFAHKPNADCPYHKPESEMHLRMKGWISDKLSGSILETRVGNTFFDVRYKDYVFECQASSL